MKKQIKNAAILALSLGVFTACSDAQSQTKKEMPVEAAPVELDPIAVAKNAKASIFKKYSEKEVRQYLHQDYIQHNPHLATGVEPIVGLLPTLKAKGTTYETHRVFQDGDFVVMHNAFTNADPLGASEVITFDIWRTENGKVVEHWDAVTPKVEQTASGRSQIDGATTVTDLDKTEANKALVKQLVDEVFIGGDPTNITNYISTEQYDQHNPDGKRWPGRSFCSD